MRFLLTSELLFTQRWFLYPPDQEPHFHPNRTTLSWVTETYPNLLEDEAPLECTIRPGEVTPPNLLTTRPKHTQQGRFISASISVKTWKLVHVCKVKSFVWTLTPDAGELSSDPFRTPQINSWFKRDGIQQRFRCESSDTQAVSLLGHLITPHASEVFSRPGGFPAPDGRPALKLSPRSAACYIWTTGLWARR